METLNDVRKAIKPLGFTVSTQKHSFGTSATYKHVESGEKLTYNVMNEERQKRWSPLVQWAKSNADSLKALQSKESISGLVFH